LSTERGGTLDEALALCRSGQLDSARRLLDGYASRNPRALLAQVLLARINIDQQCWQGARAAAHAALALNPGEAGAWYALGRALCELGDQDAAVNCYRRAQLSEPGNAEVLTQLARVLQGRGRRDAAVRLYQSALAADPSHSAARANFDQLVGPAPGGMCRLEQIREQAQRLHRAGRLPEALELHRDALRIAPHLTGIWVSAGMLADELGERSASLEFFEQAASLDPACLPAVEAARRICVSAGLAVKADRYSKQAYALKPSDDIRIAQALTIAAIQPSVEAIAASRRAYEDGLSDALAAKLRVTNLSAAQSMNGFFLAYHGENDRALQVKAAGLLAGAAPWLAATAPHCTAPSRRAGKIRIGFISAFLYDHSIGNTSRGLIAQLSREIFEVIVLRISPSKRDHVTDAMRRDADSMLDLDSDVDRARAQLAALELDILFYQDIGMEPMSYALAFARLAPVQCVSFGHPNTTGIPNMDYFVSNDLYEPDDAHTHYSERLVQLRNLPTLAYYYRPAPPAEGVRRESFGLRDAEHVYLCPQTIYKIHPEFDAVLRGILMRDPNGVVVLIRSAHYNYCDLLQQRFARTLAQVSERVLFLDAMRFPRFLQLLSLADVCLDTLHFNGMNTSLEAFSVGTPIVTLPGRLQRGRHTQAMYRKMGILDCIAKDAEDYVGIAVRLGCDKMFAEAIKRRIAARSSVLFENRDVVAEFEQFFLGALREAKPEVAWPLPSRVRNSPIAARDP
jgi:protein O-GlcNAc transferase